MQIQPVQPIHVTLKNEEQQSQCLLISLSDSELEISSNDYFDQDSRLEFIASYFRGQGRVIKIVFSQSLFKYTLSIDSIHFQPGLLINMRL